MVFSSPECLCWEDALGRQHTHVNRPHFEPRRFHPRSSFSLASSRSYASAIDDEILEGRKVYKNPRNAPSVTCPRDESAIERAVSGRNRMIAMWTPVRLIISSSLLMVSLYSRLVRQRLVSTGLHLLELQMFLLTRLLGVLNKGK